MVAEAQALQFLATRQTPAPSSLCPLPSPALGSSGCFPGVGVGWGAAPVLGAEGQGGSLPRSPGCVFCSLLGLQPHSDGRSRIGVLSSIRVCVLAVHSLDWLGWAWLAQCSLVSLNTKSAAFHLCQGPWQAALPSLEVPGLLLGSPHYSGCPSNEYLCLKVACGGSGPLVVLRVSLIKGTPRTASVGSELALEMKL